MDLETSEDTLWILLSLFNANIDLPDEVGGYLNSISFEKRERLQVYFKDRLQRKLFGLDEFLRATACDARDEQSARRFFEDVYKYAFEGGEEPDVTDYWDRPKPTDW
ncbi:MAG: hypothetical protein EP336_10600 [Rhodobacteraceae bacterium]|nr:MAG: hypothetical protein EP336_10600 [Paracoccaceae bacterium]